MLWVDGDEFTRAAVAALDDLDPLVEQWVFAQPSDRVIGAWARGAGRDPNLVDVACSRVTDENALLVLAAIESLSHNSVRKLAERATPAVAGSLLSRGDLSERQRSDLAVRYLPAVDPHAGPGGKTLLDKLGTSPVVWEQLIPLAWPEHAGLLAWIPPAALDCPRVQHALVDAMEVTAQSLDGVDGKAGSVFSTAVFARIVTALTASPTLAQAEAQRLLAIVTRRHPAIAPSVERRSHVDVGELLARAHCRGGAVCRLDGSRAHTDALGTLLSLVPLVSLPLNTLTVHAFAHRQHVDADVLAQAVAHMSWDARSSALQTVEQKLGSDSDALPDAVRLFGLGPAGRLADASHAVRQLAREGWAELARANHLPGNTAAIVASDFVPARRITANRLLAAEMCQHVDRLDDQTAETVLALLDQWDGSLTELITVACAVTHDPHGRTRLGCDPPAGAAGAADAAAAAGTLG